MATAYKVRKGDTLIGIAKKHKHKSYKTIWDDPLNRALKGKRKKPEAIQPGDIVKIPPTPEEIKARREFAKKCAEAAREHEILRDELRWKAAENRRLAERLEADIAAQEQFFAEIQRDLGKINADVKNLSGKVDTIYQIATILVSMRSLAKRHKTFQNKTKGSLKEYDKALKEHNFAMMTDVAWFVGNPMASAFEKVIAVNLPKNATPGGVKDFVGSLSAWHNDTISPSFWFKAAARFLEVRKAKNVSNWDAYIQAMRYDYETDVNNKIYKASKELNAIRAKKRKAIAEALKKAEECEASAKEADRAARIFRDASMALR